MSIKAGNKKNKIVGNKNIIEKFFKNVLKNIDFKFKLPPGTTCIWPGTNNSFIWLQDTIFNLNKYFPGVKPFLYKQNDLKILKFYIILMIIIIIIIVINLLQIEQK